MSESYQIFNAIRPTTASIIAVATGVAIKTMLQIKLGTGIKGKVTEWGISFDGSAAATPGVVELCETGSIFATVTALNVSGGDVHKFGDPNSPDPSLTAFASGITSTGFNASAEGSITAVRLFDAQLLPPTGPYIKQFPLGREPNVDVTKSLRIRVNFPVTVNCICYMNLEI